MVADVVVSRELKALQEELSAAQRARASASAHPRPPDASEQCRSPDQREAQDQLRELANEVAEFFKEAERNVAAHPAPSVLAALLLGILIGRLLGPR